MGFIDKAESWLNDLLTKIIKIRMRRYKKKRDKINWYLAMCRNIGIDENES